MCRRCDNGTEFKKWVLELCKVRNIRVVNGRSYHPQSQGAIEQPNKTFKARLRAVQAQTGSREWVCFLPQIALIVNTTRPESLPAGVTPWQAWYGRPYPNWPEISVRKAEQAACRRAQQEANGEGGDFETEGGSDVSSSSGSESDSTDSEDEMFQLSELSRRLKENQRKVAERMAKKKGGVEVKHSRGAIVLLAIPKKMRQATEPLRIPARVINKVGKVSRIFPD